MASTKQYRTWILATSLRAATAALAVATVFLLTTVVTPAAQAQTFTVIHNFTGGRDGSNPQAGLTMDRAANLYGTTSFGGGPNSLGTVFQLQRSGSNWIFRPLHGFGGGSDGVVPLARVTLGPDGNLYGTTTFGGGGSCQGFFPGCGTVFSLTPPAAVCSSALCPWTETVLYRFQGDSAGGLPYGDVIFDQSGNLYGTTAMGGAPTCQIPGGCGVVYELTRAGQDWSESVLYSFTGGSDGATPMAGVILGADGNLYGTTQGINYGNAFQLVPSGSGWTENTLHTFQGGSDGGIPEAGLVFDGSGRLYGATTVGGANDGGTVFDLTLSDGNWEFAVDYAFVGNGGPYADLVVDAAGNLYGTTLNDGRYSCGAVFKLTHSGSSWIYSSLHDFTCGTDGGFPWSNVVFDANGNLYGTASTGGTRDSGVVWEITP